MLRKKAKVKFFPKSLVDIAISQISKKKEAIEVFSVLNIVNKASLMGILQTLNRLEFSVEKIGSMDLIRKKIDENIDEDEYNKLMKSGYVDNNIKEIILKLRFYL